MSRTDAHRPYWVKETDPTLRQFFRERHNHSHGPCDLDQFFLAGWRPGHCNLEWRYTDGPVNCGCPLCSGTRWRRATTRMHRHTVRRHLHNVSKMDPREWDTVDIYDPVAACWW